MKNAISWFELPATDLDRAQKFYETILDVRMIPLESPQIRMRMFPVEDPMTGVVTTPAMGEDERLSVNRDFLTAFARQIIRQQKAATSPSDSDSD